MKARMKPLSYPLLVTAGAILGAAFGTSIPATSPSAEETVALMLWGLGRAPNTNGASESLWEVEDQGGDRTTFGIVRVKDCLFRVSGKMQRTGMPDTLQFDYVLNFAAVDSYSSWAANGHDHRIIVKLEGDRWYSKTVRNNATGRVVYSIGAGSVGTFVVDGGSVERLHGAFAHFRSVFCRGRH
jgi:hypothetical protein